MTNFPTLNFSKKAIEAAGKALRGKIPWEDNQDEAIRIFRVAHGWRDSHAYPTHRLRLQLAGQIRRRNNLALTRSESERIRVCAIR
jgi:hypothetical protein